MIKNVTRAMLERIPCYISCLKGLKEQNIHLVSSTVIARQLGLGEVQVRKDLGTISGAGKPRIGYKTNDLITELESFCGKNNPAEAVIVGAGKLGGALLDYKGFEQYGVYIDTAFDYDLKKQGIDRNGKTIKPINDFCDYCRNKDVKIGVITVPADSAQNVCDLMVNTGIKAVWNFSQAMLKVPDDIYVVNEKLAISLSMLRQYIS